MTDFDILMAHLEDGVFVEYERSPHSDRKVFIAILERKATMGKAESDLASQDPMRALSDLAFRVGRDQHHPCRLIVVAGGDSPPWWMRQVDVVQRDWAGDWIETWPESLAASYSALGLDKVRDGIKSGRIWVEG
jgi:hypothetical protein